ncbi:hypothetical protein RvY_07780 [Ramazzottius varieornatus]|uniref:Uncharacterized protein n=1 Tax=Ramazzottius varieornatus TaxID=947166 RepID=A0A1D1VCT3_RAMVA|nr:hypothetical protein RvY_07780 [Ramazzottius varieornatus]
MKSSQSYHEFLSSSFSPAASPSCPPPPYDHDSPGAKDTPASERGGTLGLACVDLIPICISPGSCSVSGAPAQEPKFEDFRVVVQHDDHWL